MPCGAVGAGTVICSQFPERNHLESEYLLAQSADWWAECYKGVDAIIHTARYVTPADYPDSEKNAA